MKSASAAMNTHIQGTTTNLAACWRVARIDGTVLRFTEHDEDVVIKAYHAVVRLATAGKVQVAKNATVVAGVRVRELEVKGTVKGDVIATERVSLAKKARIDGDVSCRLLSVQLGAQLLGFYTVTPNYVPPGPGDETD